MSKAFISMDNSSTPATGAKVVEAVTIVAAGENTIVSAVAVIVGVLLGLGMGVLLGVTVEFGVGCFEDGVGCFEEELEESPQPAATNIVSKGMQTKVTQTNDLQLLLLIRPPLPNRGARSAPRLTRVVQ